ncbi:hypothetical protein DVR14_21070 (plasmid) [Natrinema thermotolerans]|nr:hypothetical protein DVR14_16950 [Natrinema thermotolerans]QCC61136.1 hypothetical protein DVR14_21070 [Natrinema thermotolerans]
MTGYWGPSDDFVLIRDGSTPEVKYVDFGFGTEELGITKSPRGDDRYFIMDSTASDYDSGTTNILEVEIDGIYESAGNIEAEILRDYDVGTLYNHRGLGYREGSDTFITYDEDDREYVEFDQSGNIIETRPVSYGNDYGVGAIGANVDGRYRYVFPNGYARYDSYDKTQSTTAEWTSEPIEFDRPNGTVSGTVDVAGDVYDKYEFQVQTRTGSGSWQTHDSFDIPDGKSDSKELTFNTELNGSGEVSLRVQFRPSGEVRLADNGNAPQITDISLDHEHYDSNETVRAHDQFDPEQGLDFSEARALDELVVEGTNTTGASITAEFVNQQDEVVCTVPDVVNSRVDLRNECAINFTEYKNQHLFLDFEFISESGTDTLESWELTYEESTKDVEITDWKVTGGYNSDTPRDIEQTQFRSAIDSTDRFQITGVEGNDITSNVDDVRWYVNGDEVEHYTDVPVGDIPPLEQTWNESGRHTVTAEVFHGGHGTDTQSWEVSVYDILIGGQDSFSESPGGTIHVTQQFQVFEIDDAEIEYELEYDEDIVRKVSGPDNGTVDSGMSKSWEFQVVAEDYTGEPITITATHDDVRVEKSISISTATSGGAVGSIGADFTDSVVANTWLEWPLGGFVDLGQGTYIQTQTILTGGLVSVIWLHHFGTIALPVGDWTLRQLQTRTKVGLSAIIGVAGVGFVLPWIGLVSVLTGLGWYFWDSIAARFQEVISPV